MHTNVCRCMDRQWKPLHPCVHVLAAGLPQKTAAGSRPYSNTTFFVGDNIKRDRK